MNPEVHAFSPQYPLWSDGAAKRRWIWLPPGAKIDTANMDQWSFPVGAKLWKEFSRGGRRIETRLIERIGPGNDWNTDWYAVAFQWDMAETEGTAVPAGVIDDMGHNDIPARGQCRQCHNSQRVPSVVIGFSALQLDAVQAGGGSQLDAAIAAGMFTVAPPGATSPHFPLPTGDAAREAQGYLHANCGNCHNADSDVQGQSMMKLRMLTTDLAAWNMTDAYETTADVTGQLTTVGSTALLEPGVPMASAILIRLSNTPPGQVMPPVGRETADPLGVEAVRSWIAALPPTP
jgi:hypothetical protein